MNDDDRTVIWANIRRRVNEENKRLTTLMTNDEVICFIKLEYDKIAAEHGLDFLLEFFYYNQSGPGKYQQSDEEAGLIKVEER